MEEKLSVHSEKSGFDRRQFFEYFAAIGVTSAVMSACQTGEVEERGKITVDTIESAEKIAGIELTPEERKKIVKRLNRNLEIYKGLREKKIGNSMNSALVFNPIPPGMVISREKRPFRHSVVDVTKPAHIEDAAFYSVLQLAKLIKTRQITSTELTKMYLARLKKYDSKLKFVTNLTEELALKQARRADEEISSGNYRGPLHGIPYGAKDLLAVKGYKTTWGAAPYKDQVIDLDATVVEKLEEAGAVLVAKLTLGALAQGDVWYGGKTRNPWDPEGGSSGSSAGPASATAAGCLAFSIGSETNGSIISPCDRCGVTGLRPTFGRISRYGAMALSWSMDKIGPICRTVEDCAVVFNAIYGPDGRDNTLFDYPFNWDPALDVKSLRVGFYEKYFTKELIRHPKDEKRKKIAQEKQKLSNDALDVLRGLGVSLKPIDVDIDVAGTGFVLSTESAAAFDDLTRSNRDDLMKKSSWPDTFRHRRFVPAVEYIQANRYRTVLIEEMNKIFEDVDVFVEVTHSNTTLTNLTGHPAVIVPIGFVEGKPTSIVFTGKLFGEAETLAVAKAYQDVTGVHLKHPTL
ncbi:MAG: amidase [Candidatus Aminicenantes bacterium]|jgi:Asp-tRNA(Asn)/Glu-tRNA(Gln) amidotransferase A subunit family amidase